MSHNFEALLEAFQAMPRCSDGNGVAPHKPLVVLYALASLQRGQPHIGFTSTEHLLAPLLQKYWFQNGTARVEDPFVRLHGDGFWSLNFPVEAARTTSGAISAAWLRGQDARAGFDKDTLDMFLEKPSRMSWAARVLIFDVQQSANPIDLAGELGIALR